MSDLNQALNNSTYVNEPVFSVPYIDAGGLGLILTIGLPVYRPGTNTLYGVVAIDITLQDIFKDAIYFNNGDGSYIFIIDNKGRVIFHPSMPALMPSDSVNYYHINQLERGTNFGAVIESMIAGQSGSKAIDMIKVL
uniref:Cache domain-containing protein n=1 Tax=Ciona savignyi TaxID=51511 RepID=H2YLU1_CIOSA